MKRKLEWIIPLLLMIFFIFGCAQIKEMEKFLPLKVHIEIKSHTISPQVAKPGDKIKQEIHFILSSSVKKELSLKESVVVEGKGIKIVLLKRTTQKLPGEHVSLVEFIIPEDLPSGEYYLITTFVVENIEKTIKGKIYVKR